MGEVVLLRWPDMAATVIVVFSLVFFVALVPAFLASVF